jgi:hypothetical protein
MLPSNNLNKSSKYTLEHSTPLSISVGDDGYDPEVVDEDEGYSVKPPKTSAKPAPKPVVVEDEEDDDSMGWMNE